MRDGLAVELDFNFLEKAGDWVVDRTHVIRCFQVVTVGFCNTIGDFNLGLIQLDETVWILDFKLDTLIVHDSRSFGHDRRFAAVPSRLASSRSRCSTHTRSYRR